MSDAEMREHVAALDALASELFVAIVTNPKSTPAMTQAIGRMTGRLTFMRAMFAVEDDAATPAPVGAA